MLGLYVGLGAPRAWKFALPVGAPVFNAVGTLSGAVIGQASTVSGVDVAGEGVSLGYQWEIDGVPIAGETGSSYTPDPADDGKWLWLVVRATNGVWSTFATTPAIRVTAPAPLASGSIGEQIFTRGEAAPPLDVSGEFTGLNLVFSLDVDSSIAVIDPATGVITWATGVTRAAQPVQVMAQNSGGAASLSTTLTVNPPAPVAGTLSDVTYVEGEGGGSRTFEAAPGFAGEVETFAISPDPDWLEIDPVTGRVTVATDAPRAAADVTITGSNPGGSDDVVVRITVVLAAPQAVGTIPPQAFTIGTSPEDIDASLVILGTDVTFSLAPEGVASITSVGLISFDASALSAPVLVTVTGTNASGSAVAPFLVSVVDVAPALIGSIPPQDLVQGGDAVVIDLDEIFAGQNLELKLLQGGSVATLNAAARTLTLSTANVTPGQAVTVQAKNTGGTASTSFLVVVTVAAPVVSGSIPDQVLYKGAASPALNAFDAISGPDVSLAVIAGQSVASVNPVTGAITLNTATVTGPTVVTIQGVNNADAVEITFTVEVRVVPPAVIGVLSDLTLDKNSGPQVIGTAHVFSGEGLTFSLASGGSVVSINTVTGDVTSPTGTVFEDLLVRVRATNASGTADAEFLLSVAEVETGPPQIPFGYALAARPGPAAGQVYVCVTAPEFWGDGVSGGDELGGPGHVYLTVGPYEYVLYGTLPDYGAVEVGETLPIGPAPEALPIDQVRGLPIGQAVIGESFILGPIPAAFFTDGMDAATCALLDTPTDLHGQTVQIGVRAVNDHGIAGAPVTQTLTLPGGSSLEGALLLDPSDPDFYLVDPAEPDFYLVEP